MNKFDRACEDLLRAAHQEYPDIRKGVEVLFWKILFYVTLFLMLVGWGFAGVFLHQLKNPVPIAKPVDGK